MPIWLDVRRALLCEWEVQMMSMLKLLATVSVLSCLAFPAMALARKGGSYHYTGGPKSEVPYHTGKKETAVPTKSSSGGSHHYYGGPKSEVPHHIGPKKD
jgi:hypothetical protein